MTATPGLAGTAAASRQVYRIEVHPRPEEPDPLGQGVLRVARQSMPGVKAVRSSRVYLVEASLRDDDCERIGDALLADRINQHPVFGIGEPEDGARTVEVHYLPGVMDPVAQSTRQAIAEMTDLPASEIEVRTGFRFDFVFAADARVSDERLTGFATRNLANTVIQSIHLEPLLPDTFAEPSGYTYKLTHVPIRDLDDEALRRLSREGHLFLSLEEMQAIQAYYRKVEREPTDVELETLAQTWSEHCVHKTLKSRVRYVEPGPSAIPGLRPDRIVRRPGHTLNADGSITIDNLLKSTIAAATRKLMDETELGDWCVSVFEDNAGIVKFDETDGVCIKVETHNHPSAIEPYGGAATGIGGCIRDILGTGLAAWPIANTDTFCVADPNTPFESLPQGVIHPRRILERVVDGVRDYGNRKGIPTVDGGVYFHEDYLGNPLVFAGCIGLIPLDKCFGSARPGDHIIVLGGATGRDGIHGATFSSAELTDTHADEFGHAVQIGNPITQKTAMDVIMQARDHADGCLFSAITDCGAGGFSSAVGEMGEKVGAKVHLERAPLKYAGLSYDEIWISEAQERMVLAVPAGNVEKVRALCRAEDVPFCDLGEYGVTNAQGEPQLVLTYEGEEVGRLSMPLLHEGIPTPVREATWGSDEATERRSDGGKNGERRHEAGRSVGDLLRALLGQPNIASKHWIVRQYDHEVQGASVVKPLVGPGQDGPSDAAVIRPKLSSNRGIAIGNGLQTGLGEKTPGGDSYWMALAAIDECVRNLVCVGADPTRIAILDNFCWPSCDDPVQLGSLVRAAEACYDGALAYATPFVSGKDSLNNQFTTDDGKVIAIPPTLLISGLGIVRDVTRCVTMDAKRAGDVLVLVGSPQRALAGSHYALITGDDRGGIPKVDLELAPRCARAVASLIESRLVAAAHDVSDGGLLVAAAEMAFAGRIGLELQLDEAGPELAALLFAESPSLYLLEIAPEAWNEVRKQLGDADVPCRRVGNFADHQRLVLPGHVDEALDALREAWRAPLDW